MKLSDIRKAKGLTQAELATLLGKNQSVIAMWETQKSKPRLDTFLLLAKVLDEPMDIIFKCFSNKN